MQTLICQAIRAKSTISFVFEGKLRTAEPFTLGYHKDTGNMVLSAYCLTGGNSQPWDMYKVSNLSKVSILNGRTNPNRAGYKKNDSRMKQILCEL